jgi:hypothetical protein
MTTTEQLTGEERLRRQRRKGSYHLVASKNKLPRDLEEDEDDMLFRHLTAVPLGGLRLSDQNQLSIQEVKKRLFREIASSGGDTATAGFQAALDMLTKLYDPTKFDARKKPSRSSTRSSIQKDQPLQLEGMWITLSRTNFSECLGQNPMDEYMYTLGRMSFGA